MPLYESVFIVRQDVATTQVESLAAQFAEFIRAGGGKVTKTEQWGLRTLAYRIKKNKKGYYVLFNIDAPSAAVSEMERNMRLHEDVLRYLSIRVDELEEQPSAMLRKQDERDMMERPMMGGGAGRGPSGGRGGRLRPRADDTFNEGDVA